MKPFRLSNLVRVRRLQEKQAASELAVRAAERRRAEERKENADRRLGLAGLPGKADSTTWQAAVAARAAARAAVNDARTADIAAKGKESEAHGQWSEAKTRISTLDKLAQRHLIAELNEDLKAEQRALDEIAAQRASQNTGEDR